MKKSILFYAFLLIISCNLSSSDNNLEGIYTCKYEHEFAKTEDTLLLTRINESGNYFQIVRHSGGIRYMDGKERPKQIITEKWKLEYDNNKKVLTEMKSGKILIWNPDKQLLILGNREYVKK